MEAQGNIVASLHIKNKPAGFWAGNGFSDEYPDAVLYRNLRDIEKDLPKMYKKIQGGSETQRYELDVTRDYGMDNEKHLQTYVVRGKELVKENRNIQEASPGSWRFEVMESTGDMNDAVRWDGKKVYYYGKGPSGGDKMYPTIQEAKKDLKKLSSALLKFGRFNGEDYEIRIVRYKGNGVYETGARYTLFYDQKKLVKEQAAK